MTPRKSRIKTKSQTQTNHQLKLQLFITTCIISIRVNEGFLVQPIINTYQSFNNNGCDHHGYPLFSTLFFDDDDINWDDDDDTDDINFDIQYKGRAFENKQINGDDGATKGTTGGTVVQEKQQQIDEEEDDTDESYYDNLFQQQDGIVLSQEELEADDDDDDDNNDFGITFNNVSNNQEEQNIIIQEEQKEEYTPATKIPTTAPAAATITTTTPLLSSKEKDKLQKELIQKAEEYHESMKQLKNEFNKKRIKLQNQSKSKRQQKRDTLKQFQLEERAMFLAFRALRQQSRMDYHPAVAATATTTSATTKIKSNANNKDNLQQSSTTAIATSTATAIMTIPSPTLSISSTKNYKRKEDIINNDLIKIEQRLYGDRFKKTYNVYLRLLQTLEEMKVKSKQYTSDYIFDKVEQSVLVQIGGGTTASATATATLGDASTKSKSEPIMNRYDIEESIEMNQYQQKRMSTITALALYRKQHYGSGSESISSSSTTKSSSTSSISKDRIVQEIQKKYNLDIDQIDLQDLTSILRIRGNIKRRGRLPKSRRKVLEQLTISFSTDIFQ